MKLHEIIQTNFEDQKSVLIEKMVPCKKSLKIYFSDYFGTNDLILMVTSVTNATTYGKIVTGSDFIDAIEAWIGEAINYEDTDSDSFIEFETISANSIPFEKL
jgi:hypothetical protein